MKKYVLTAALVLAATASFAVITGSKHNMSNTGLSSAYGNTAADQICIYCHAPHNAKISGLIWNRNNSAAAITMYNKNASSTLSYNTAATLQNVTKTCLGCHDGTVAVDEYGNHTGTAAKSITSSAKLGTNLTLSHPIGFSMAESRTNDTDIAAVAGNVVTGWTGKTLRLFGTSQLECATCHDVHNKYGQTSLLVMNNKASALCLECHQK